jgi:glyoxylase-like metal-dependent hydrolase (beta-lactamase superfamily II)
VTVIPFVGEANVRHGEPQVLSPLIRRVVANNPGPFTYHGTCTYIIGRGHVAVVDPGPNDPAHVNALLAALGPRERITHLVVTHTHTDHSPATRALRARTGAPTYGFGPQVRIDDPDTTRVFFDDPELDNPPSTPPPRGGDRAFRADVVLRDGDVIEGGGWSLEAVHTPGHASNHLCYLIRETEALCTGDHVMAWATTVVPPPDGNLGDYMASLRRLLTRFHGVRMLPAHGPDINDSATLLSALIAHREERLTEILDILVAAPATIGELVPRIYSGTTPKQLWHAAGNSLYAHLIFLHERGLIETMDGAQLLRSSRVKGRFPILAE